LGGAQGPPADLNSARAATADRGDLRAARGAVRGRAQFRAWTQAAADVQDRAHSERGLADLFGYGQQLVARKRDDPGDDVIARLSATEGVHDVEAVAMGMFLLFAGHETTVVAIGMGAVHLLTNPPQCRALLDDPTRIGPAVDEILRPQDTGGGGIPRYARTDLQVAGITVRAGELVLLDTGAANHDGSVFPEPDAFDVGRRATGHVTFGHGARYCIGAPLARIELQAVFSQLIPRFPQMRLAVDVAQLVVDSGTLTGGLVEVPVTW
jgi:cytochrome P450